MSTPLPAPGASSDAHCQNCGSPLYGEHCYACGQPTKGLVRHFSSIAGDIADTLFNLDGRLLRTLPALLMKPGFLSREYFDGHRVRYVSPVRLFVFLCIATFFAAKLASPSLDLGDVQIDGDEAGETSGGGLRVGTGDSNGFAKAMTPEAVEAQRAEALAGIAEGRKETANLPGMGLVMDEAAQQVNAAADARLGVLRAAAGGTAETAAAVATPTPRPDERAARGPMSSDEGDAPSFNFNGKPWDAKTNPLVIEALPAAANDWLNAQLGHVPENWARIRKDPDLLRNAFYSALPTALFLLVPMFALLLKALYLFKRRLYMEHLVVALHGHAFVCAMLLVLMAITSVERLSGEPAWLAAPLGWLEWAVLCWVPVYLWLHLKRVYGQGVVLTTLKFSLLGVAELVLLSIVGTGALLSALVWL